MGALGALGDSRCGRVGRVGGQPVGALGALADRRFAISDIANAPLASAAESRRVPLLASAAESR